MLEMQNAYKVNNDGLCAFFLPSQEGVAEGVGRSSQLLLSNMPFMGIAAQTTTTRTIRPLL